MIIKNTTILSLYDLSIRKNTDILIEGNKIEKIGKNLVGPGEVIDGSRFYLIPGMVNTHAHTAMALLRGAAEDVNINDWFNKYIWIYEKNLTPEDVYIGTLIGSAEMLLSGVTFVADHYFYMDKAYQAYEEIGIRADLSWAVFGVGDDWEEEFNKALKFAEDYRDKNSRLHVSLGPHSPYICPDSFLKNVAAKAQELNLKMHIHVSEEENQVIRSLKERKMTPVEILKNTGILREGTILAHAYYATDEDLKLIKQSRSGIAHCAKTYMKFGDIHNFLPRVLEFGISCGLGTDGPCSNNTMNIFEVARDAALLAKSSMKDPEIAKIHEILPLLTRGGEVLGIKNYGVIEKGSIADLVLINPNTPNMHPENNIFANILYSLSEKNIDTVIVDGKIVVRNGKLLNINLEELYKQSDKILKRLAQKVQGKPMQEY